VSKTDLMQHMASEITACLKCPLWKGRTKAVPGEGNLDTSVMFVGEAPGYWEDLNGLPFVGAAGKVLDSFLLAAKLPRDRVFITNVVKCRPPRNRAPKPAEISTCTSLYLNSQIRLIHPCIVATLGSFSTSYILSQAGFEEVESITKVRGKAYGIRFLDLSLTVVPMFHPAAVLHNPKYREELQRDFGLLRVELKTHHIK
jgi:uracil-DNA glycosylase family 4